MNSQPFPFQKSDRYDNGTISFPCERSLRHLLGCGTIVTLYKGGGSDDPDNYRG